MRPTDALLAELEHEGATTRNLLAAIPGDKLDWKPHDKSMSIGHLAMHIATAPQIITHVASRESFDVSEIDSSQDPVASTDAILAAFDENLAEAKTYIQGLDDAQAFGMWSLVAGENELMTMPRVAVLRSFLLNHIYHHRGQLSVYLRMLDVSLPSVYGPTADINPFEAAMS